ncbi:slipin family protein [Myceligenerans crystallogenes]|uniref:Band 7 domain-containing protein n=1 Tax=Myceligenerans crystallogenes TaxID=316335 RepID=A0ABN2NKE9_9MICO
MSLVPRITVHATELAVEYVDGRFTRVLGPGRHRHPRRARHERVRTADRLTSLAPQEVLTSDGLTVRVSLAVRWRVSDARTFLEQADDAFDVVYLAAQVALRDALITLDADALARHGRRELGGLVLGPAREAGAGIGVEVVDAVVKDVILPLDMRSAYAELATAKVRGAAQLEAARAETAALRSLANGAKLLEDHPALARLRLIQALPAGSKVEIIAPQ